jgi:two-component system sensor kinase FixL
MNYGRMRQPNVDLGTGTDAAVREAIRLPPPLTDAPHAADAPAARRAADRKGARIFTLRTYLAAMALAVMVPMGILGAFGVWQVVEEYQLAYQERLRATARLLAIALDSEIQMRKVAIMALADSPLMDQATSPEFYQFAKQIGAGLGGWVKVNTPEQPILNTRFAFGSPLPPRLAAWNAERAARFHVTDILRAPDVVQPFAQAVGPVVREGRVVATVSIPFLADSLNARLSEGLFTSDGVLCLLDGSGRVIARTRKQAEYIGHQVAPWLLQAIAPPAGAVAMGNLLDGGAVIVATAHPSEAPNWTVVVAQPLAGYYNEWFRPLMVLAGGGLVVLLALLLLVDRFALWLVRPLKALTQNASVVARGGRERLPAAHHTSSVAEFETLRLSLNAAAQVMDGRAEAIRVAFASARRERNLLHSVVNGTADPTYVKDSDGRLVLANAAGLAMLGLPAAKALGQALLEPGAAGMEAASQAEDRQVIASGQSVMIERTIVDNGERRTFLGTKSAWRSATGEVLGVVMIIHDITEWKRSENRLREIQGELIRTGRLSAMGAMAGATPAVPTLPLGVASGAIEDACTQAMRAGEIVSRLRDFIGRGVASMRIEAIGGLIGDACALAMPQDTRGRVSLHVSVDPELNSVFVDRLQIQQVLVNLVLNAVQSMAGSPRQAVTITACRDAGGDTCIEVADTGPGIPASMLAEVFEPFVSTRPDGLGMGLAIARMIVAAHGGTLAARNNEEGGATLTLVLPAVLSMEDAHA